MYYLLKKKKDQYLVVEGYLTLAQLCRSCDKPPLVIKADKFSFYPNDMLTHQEIKDLFVKVDINNCQIFKPGVNDDHHTFLDVIY